MKTKILAILFLLATILIPSIGMAQALEPGQPLVTEGNETTGWICPADDNIWECTPRLYNFALGIAGIIAVGVLIAAGYLRMTSGGDGQQLTTAKEMGGAVAAGILLLLVAYILLRFLNPQLLEFKQLERLDTGGTTNLNSVGTADFNITPVYSGDARNIRGQSVTFSAVATGPALTIDFYVVVGGHDRSIGQSVRPGDAGNTWNASQTWDSTTVPNGTYNLKLVGVGADNKTIARYMEIVVNNTPSPSR